MAIKRSEIGSSIKVGLSARPAVMLLGPRQCGKTTMARSFLRVDDQNYFDLENPADLARLDNPHTVLAPLRGLVVIDEFQRRPDLLPLLRVLTDRRPIPCRFLLLGSASVELLRGISESLAGRVHIVEMGGFLLRETGLAQARKLWLRGGFPDSYLAKSGALSFKWRGDFLTAICERDIPLLGFRFPAQTIRRFLTMLAHYHGQVWNGSEIGSALGVSHHAARRYLDALQQTYLLRELPPWYANLGKRLVKSPKIYLRDSGLVHALLGIADQKQLFSHPKLGASWEGFVLEQILGLTGSQDAYFFATQSRSELDLLLIRQGKPWGFEFKCSDGPTMTRSMRLVKEELGLEHLWVVYPGERSYPLEDRVDCIALKDLGKVCTRWS